ncbi:MAG TPA: response regulator [Ktedonobacteraceae bacterium]|nr:response regulator [Ktedonobacteraceae bacterium]
MQRFHKLYALLVDSDAGAHLKLQQALDDSILLRSATTVAEARQYLAESVPDVLICEACIGQESGLELCRYIRSTPALYFLPVMLLTSLATLQDKVAGFEAGADDYVVKPFDARHLVARIRLLSRIKRLEQNQD